MNDADERRLLLVRYLRSLTCPALVSEIVEQSRIYGGQGRTDRCHADLKVLEKRQVAKRHGRPAAWSLTEAA